jgi:CRISPR-associated protein Csb2
MSFSIDVEFIRSTFDASSMFDNSMPEAIPHPARLHNAFVDAAAQGEVEDAFKTLSAWEMMEPPRIFLPHHGDPSERVAYVPTNQHAKTATDVWKTQYPARKQKVPVPGLERLLQIASVTYGL